MAAGYLVIMTVLAMGLRRPRAAVPDGTGPRGGTGARPSAQERSSAGTRGGWPALIRHMIGTAVGGYLVLCVVVVIYYYEVARVGGQFLWSAFTGTALLTGIALPVFAATSWLVGRGGQRRGDTTGEGQVRRE
jgi:Family of unknown function (DUF6256)